MKRIFTKGFPVVLLTLAGWALAFTAQGQTFTETFATNGSNDRVTALTTDKDGNVFAIVNPTGASTSSLVEYVGGAGSPQPIATGTGIPIADNNAENGTIIDGLASDSQGNIYVSTNVGGTSGIIYKFDVTHSYAKSPLVTGSANIGYFEAITVGPDDNLYAIQYNTNGNTAGKGRGDYEVAMYPTTSPTVNGSTTGGTALYTDLDHGFFAGGASDEYSHIVGLQVDASLNIYVADGWDENVLFTSTNGSNIYKLIKPGSGNNYTLQSPAVASNLHATALAMNKLRTNLYATVSLTNTSTFSVVEFTGGTGTPTTLYTGLTNDAFWLPFALAYVSDQQLFAGDGGGDASHTGNLDEIFSAPTTQASGISFSSTTEKATTISWSSNGDGANRAVFMALSSAGSISLTNGTTYSPSTTFGSGTAAGTGWSCVYNSTSSTLPLTVSGLSVSTGYKVMVVEYNGTTTGSPTSQVFDTGTAANNPNTFTTIAAPVLATTGGSDSYSVGGTVATVDAGLTVTAGQNLSSASVVISSNYSSGDALNFNAQNGISGTYSGGTLTLTGSATPANYQTALESITFSSTAGSSATRTVSFTVNDGTSGSNTATKNIAVSTSTTITGLSSVTTSPTNAGSITYTATFAASVSNLSTGDFQVTSSGVSGASVSSVSGSGTSWTVTVNTGSGDGTVQLSMNSSAGVTPSVSNVPFNSAITYTIDKTVPTVAIGSPNIAYANSSTPVSWQITWSDANLKTSSINPTGIFSNVNTTGTATVSTSINLTPGSGGNPTTAQFVGLTGDGTLGFTVPAGSAQDNAGNSASASSPSTTVIVDNTAPTISIGAPSVSSTVNGPVTYTITYADANFNSSTLSSSDITLNTTGTANASSKVVTVVTPTTRTVTLSGITGDGTLGISIGASTATDLAGNPAPASSASTTFSVDNTPPTVLSISRSDPNPIKDNVLDYQVTFSEPVTGVDPSDFTMVNSGVTTGAISVTGVSSTVYNVSIINVNGTGTAQLTLNGSGTGIADLSGNAIAAGFAGDTYNVDQTAPVANSLVYKSSNTNQLFAATGDVVSLSFTTSETINAPTVSIAGHSITATNTSGNDWVASYQMTGGDTEGRIPFSLSFTDLVGNPQPGVPYSDVTAGDDVEFDMTAPTISIGAPSVAQIGSGGTGTVSYTVTYGDTNFNTISLSPSDITLNTNATTATGTVGVVNSGTTSTVTISNITGAGTLGISIGANTASDQAGNMAPATGPSTTFTVLSNQSALSGLAISTNTLSPTFNGSNTGNYTVTVPWIISGIMFTPTASDVNATIDVAGNTVASGTQSPSVPLALGANTIHITVTAQDGVTKTIYTVIVTRANSNNANLARIQLNPGLALTETSSTATTVNYTASAKSSISSVTLTPLTGNAGATVTVNGNPVTSGTASQSIPLAVGQTTITTVVTAQNGKIVKTYTVVVTRAPSDNANLATIKVNPPLKLSKTSETATEADYTASARNAFSTVTITPTTIDAGATVTVNGDPVTSGATSNGIALAVGQTTITTVVTAQDGTTQKTYIVTVTRAPSDNANMGSILLSPQLVLTQTAATDGEVDYTASAKSTLGSVTLTPIPWDPTATVTVNGQNVTPGTPSDDITLVTGPNIITTVVTAGDGTTQKTYIITLTKAAASLNTAYQPISVSNPTERPQMMGEEITVHQGISPNGDGINDFLIIDNIASHPNNKLQIMNRSGQLIYEAVNYDNSTNVFDGHSNKNGQMQLPGTYFYSLDYTDNGETKHKTGYIVLKY